MPDCIFCAILAGKAEASFVYRGEQVSAFLDIHPINRGHVLVVPNRHAERLADVPASVAGEIFQLGQRILQAIQASGLKCEGANLFLSDGKVAGQEVPHAHLHIVPRYRGDRQRMGFSHADPEPESRGELNRVASELAKLLG